MWCLFVSIKDSQQRTQDTRACSSRHSILFHTPFYCLLFTDVFGCSHRSKKFNVSNVIWSLCLQKRDDQGILALCNRGPLSSFLSSYFKQVFTRSLLSHNWLPSEPVKMRSTSTMPIRVVESMAHHNAALSSQLFPATCRQGPSR